MKTVFISCSQKKDSALLLFYLARMGRYVRRSAFSGKKYTRILVPSFPFIMFADIFIFIISLFEGGLFRGWLAKKTYVKKA